MSLWIRLCNHTYIHTYTAWCIDYKHTVFVGVEILNNCITQPKTAHEVSILAGEI